MNSPNYRNKFEKHLLLLCIKGGDTLSAIHALTHAVRAGGSAAFKFCPQPLPKFATSSVRFSPQFMPATRNGHDFDFKIKIVILNHQNHDLILILNRLIFSYFDFKAHSKSKSFYDILL